MKRTWKLKNRGRKKPRAQRTQSQARNFPLFDTCAPLIDFEFVPLGTQSKPTATRYYVDWSLENFLNLRLHQDGEPYQVYGSQLLNILLADSYVQDEFIKDFVLQELAFSKILARCDAETANHLDLLLPDHELVVNNLWDSSSSQKHLSADSLSSVSATP